MLVSDYCELYYSLPTITDRIERTWQGFERNIKTSQETGKISETDEFVKYLLDYAIVNEERYYQKCLEKNEH